MDTFLAAIRSVGTATTLAAAGVYLHYKGMVTAETKVVLAKFSQQVAIPALFFSKIVNCPQNFSSEKCPNVMDYLVDAWILLLWPCYVVGWGLLVGYVATYIARTPSTQRRSVVAAIAFANSAGLPITLLSVVQSNVPRTQGQSSTVDPNLFLSIYLLLYQVLQWGIGGWLLAPDHRGMKLSHSPETRFIQQRSAIELTRQPTLSDLLEAGSSCSNREGQEEQKLLSSPSSRWSLASTESSSATSDSPLHITDNDDGINYSETVWKVLSKACQPPVIGSLLGLCVAAVKPLRGLFVDLNGRDKDAALEWFFDAVYAIGKAAVPVNMAVLGVNLSMAAQSKGGEIVSRASIAAVVIGKMIVMPTIGILTTVLLRRYFWNIPESIHSSFYIVLMIVFITPTANNVAVMTDLAGSGMSEGIAKIIGWEYMISPVILPLSVMLVVRVATL